LTSAPALTPFASAEPPPLRSLAAAALLREGHTIILPATGTSMRPLFAPGDRLRVRPARAADARPGDVVVLARADRLVAHRLVYASPTALITRGDDAATDDPAAPPATLVGIVDVPLSPRALYSALRALFR
jgi:Peptidase S24-like